MSARRVYLLTFSDHSGLDVYAERVEGTLADVLAHALVAMDGSETFCRITDGARRTADG